LIGMSPRDQQQNRGFRFFRLAVAWQARQYIPCCGCHFNAYHCQLRCPGLPRSRNAPASSPVAAAALGRLRQWMLGRRAIFSDGRRPADLHSAAESAAWCWALVRRVLKRVWNQGNEEVYRRSDRSSNAGSRPRVTTAAENECVSRPAISADAFDCSCRKGTYGVWIGHERAKHLCAPVVQRQWEEMEQTHYMRTSGGDRTARGRFRPSPILLLLPALSGGSLPPHWHRSGDALWRLLGAGCCTRDHPQPGHGGVRYVCGGQVPASCRRPAARLQRGCVGVLLRGEPAAARPVPVSRETRSRAERGGRLSVEAEEGQSGPARHPSL
jgi:hypothetical protein